MAIVTVSVPAKQAKDFLQNLVYDRYIKVSESSNEKSKTWPPNFIYYDVEGAANSLAIFFYGLGSAGKIDICVMPPKPDEAVGPHVLIKLEGGHATFEGCTDANVNVTIIDWDVREDDDNERPAIYQDHCRPVTTNEKMERHIEDIRNQVDEPCDIN